jgi:hypothetical protein
MPSRTLGVSHCPRFVFGPPVGDDFRHGDDYGHPGEIAVAAPLKIAHAGRPDADVDRESSRDTGGHPEQEVRKRQNPAVTQGSDADCRSESLKDTSDCQWRRRESKPRLPSRSLIYFPMFIRKSMLRGSEDSKRLKPLCSVKLNTVNDLGWDASGGIHPTTEHEARSNAQRTKSQKESGTEDQWFGRWLRRRLRR